MISNIDDATVEDCVKFINRMYQFTSILELLQSLMQ